MTNGRWDYFKPKRVFRDAGVKIIRCSLQGSTMRTTEYRVRRLCHTDQNATSEATDSAVTTMTHSQIKEKAKRKRKLCAECAMKAAWEARRAKAKSSETPEPVPGAKAEELDHDQFMHWPVPPSILADPPRIRIA